MTDALAIIASIVAVLSGGSGLVAWYQVWAQSRTQREDRQLQHALSLDEVRQTAAEVALEAWQALATERQREADVAKAEADKLRERLRQVEVRLTETERRLTETEKKLEAETHKSMMLELKLVALEKERASWQRERAALMKRIEELEACR